MCGGCKYCTFLVKLKCVGVRVCVCVVEIGRKCGTFGCKDEWFERHRFLCSDLYYVCLVMRLNCLKVVIVCMNVV